VLLTRLSLHQQHEAVVELQLQCRDQHKQLARSARGGLLSEVEQLGRSAERGRGMLSERPSF
jgi:hypothetical protein